MIGLAAAATALAYFVGLAIGLVAGYSRSIADPLLMRSVDVMLAFPPLLFLLVLIAGAGSSGGIHVIGVAASQAPCAPCASSGRSSRSPCAPTSRRRSPGASGRPP